MPQWLVVMEAQSKAPVYSVLLDVLERRLGARRILRAAWVIEAATAESVARSLVYYRPYNDGLLIVPFSEDRLERNLRGAEPPVLADATREAAIAIMALDQTPE